MDPKNNFQDFNFDFTDNSDFTPLDGFTQEGGKTATDGHGKINFGKLLHKSTSENDWDQIDNFMGTDILGLDPAEGVTEVEKEISLQFPTPVSILTRKNVDKLLVQKSNVSKFENEIKKVKDVLKEFRDNVQINKKNFDEECERKIQIFEKVIKTNESFIEKKIKVFRNTERKKEQEKFIIKGNGTKWTNLILKCSDSFEIIFSYMKTSDLALHVMESCSFFYNVIQSKVKIQAILRSDGLSKLNVEQFICNFGLSDFRIYKEIRVGKRFEKSGMDFENIFEDKQGNIQDKYERVVFHNRNSLKVVQLCNLVVKSEGRNGGRRNGFWGNQMGGEKSISIYDLLSQSKTFLKIYSSLSIIKNLRKIKFSDFQIYSIPKLSTSLRLEKLEYLSFECETWDWSYIQKNNLMGEMLLFFANFPDLNTVKLKWNYTNFIKQFSSYYSRVNDLILQDLVKGVLSLGKLRSVEFPIIYGDISEVFAKKILSLEKVAITRIGLSNLSRLLKDLIFHNFIFLLTGFNSLKKPIKKYRVTFAGYIDKREICVAVKCSFLELSMPSVVGFYSKSEKVLTEKEGQSFVDSYKKRTIKDGRLSTMLFSDYIKEARCKEICFQGVLRTFGVFEKFCFLNESVRIVKFSEIGSATNNPRTRYIHFKKIFMSLFFYDPCFEKLIVEFVKFEDTDELKVHEMKKIYEERHFLLPLKNLIGSNKKHLKSIIFKEVVSKIRFSSRIARRTMQSGNLSVEEEFSKLDVDPIKTELIEKVKENPYLERLEIAGCPWQDKINKAIESKKNVSKN